MIGQPAYDAQWPTARAISRTCSTRFLPPICCRRITRATADAIPELTGELHHAIAGFLARYALAPLAGQSGRHHQGTGAAKPARHHR